DAAELQAAALAQGEMEHARVLAERASARVADLARARGDVARQELAEVALAYEADAGGVLLGRGRQPGLGGDAAHLALGQRAEREVGGGQRLLAEQVQEIALVLVAVERAQQPVAPAVALHPRVVSGGDALGAERQRRVEEMTELDLAVAQ